MMKSLDKIYISSVFGLASTLAPPKDNKAELIKQIEATGYTFELEPDKLADYLISECDNYNFNNKTHFNYVDFLEAYLTEHPQYKKDMATPFKGLLAIDETKTAFDNLGKSLKDVSYKLTKIIQDDKPTNQKWYNQFNKRRKR